VTANALVIVAALAACISAAAAIDSPPPNLLDKGRTPVSIERQYDIPGFVDGRATSSTCPIRFTDPYFGYLPEETYDIDHKAPVSMQCFDPKANVIGDDPVRYDEQSKRWKRDMQRFFDAQVSFEPDTKKRYDKATHFFELTAKNSQGFAFTQDDLIGEERGRRRMLRYCLFHPPKVLCGDGEMGYVQDIKRHPKNDLTSYALKILRSIEFLDESASAPGSAASQASSAR